LAGRLLCYDQTSHLLLISRDTRCVAVDVSICLDPMTSLPFLLEEQVQIMVIGHLEKVMTPLHPPLLPPFAGPPEVDMTLVLRAILLKEVAELDLKLWNEGLKVINGI